MNGVTRDRKPRTAGKWSVQTGDVRCPVLEPLSLLAQSEPLKLGTEPAVSMKPGTPELPPRDNRFGRA